MHRVPSVLPLKANAGSPDQEWRRWTYWTQLARVSQASSLGSVADTANEFRKAQPQHLAESELSQYAGAMP